MSLLSSCPNYRNTLHRFLVRQLGLPRCPDFKAVQIKRSNLYSSLYNDILFWELFLQWFPEELINDKTKQNKKHKTKQKTKQKQTKKLKTLL